jgi:hypothetical protein
MLGLGSGVLLGGKLSENEKRLAEEPLFEV